MPAFKNIISTTAVTGGKNCKFDFKRNIEEHKEWNGSVETVVPAAVVTETTIFYFTTEQIDSLRVAEDSTNRTDTVVIGLLTDQCVETLKGVA